jgi:hypothetical protein
MSVRPSPCISVAAIGRICVIFDNEGFHEDVLRKYKFGKNLAQIPGTCKRRLSQFCERALKSGNGVY